MTPAERLPFNKRFTEIVKFYDVLKNTSFYINIKKQNQKYPNKNEASSPNGTSKTSFLLVIETRYDGAGKS